MKLSVLMPVKNAMPFLKEALASLEAQTHRDFVVLAWDNGSEDGSVEELRRWIPSRLPGEVFTGSPLSVGGALRELVLRAGTPLCARMDGDDACHPERFERQLHFWKSHPGLAALGAQVECFGEAGKSAEAYQPLPLHHRDIVYAFLRRTPLVHPTILFDREAVLAAGNYRADRPVEDYELFLRLVRNGAQLANMPDSLLRYRLHPASAAQRMLRAGTLHAQMLEDLAEQGPALFGLSAKTLRQLKAKKNSCALFPMRRLIAHRRQIDPSPASAHWRNPELIAAMRYLVGRHDLLTRGALALLDPAHASPAEAGQKLGGKILRNLGVRSRR